MSIQRNSTARGVTMVAAALSAAACSDLAPMGSDVDAGVQASLQAVAPAPLVMAAVGGESRLLWPFTGSEIAADAQHVDPINLIFVGEADPMSIRAALLELDGNRTAFPPLPFFQCTWADAMGGNQVSYAPPDGWTGSAIQLECGSYENLRFHLRLFRLGGWTVANAHFETIVPGTHDHQVLNWELAEQFVTADIARAGLLAAPPAQTNPINPAPFFRTIHPLIYFNPALAPLHPLINAVVIDAQTIGIRTDGRATVLALGRRVEPVAGQFVQEIVIAFNQVIPKPICAGPADFVHVSGPLVLRQQVTVSASGVLARTFHADGELMVTPVNPQTGQPLAPPSPAEIRGEYRGMMNRQIHQTSSFLEQVLRPAGQSEQRSLTDWKVGPNNVARYSHDQTCG